MRCQSLWFWGGSYAFQREGFTTNKEHNLPTKSKSAPHARGWRGSRLFYSS
jgi:hypothetical protein